MSGASSNKPGLFILAALILSGCATGSKPTTIADMLRVFSFSGSESAGTNLTEQIRLDLGHQRPEAALERLRNARAAGYAQAGLAGHYPAVINALIKEADAAHAAGEAARAGRLYRSALTDYPDSPVTAGKILVSPGSLHQSIDQCADDLMQQGLVHYRTGHFDNALDTWRKISTFLPGHQPSLIAIETTQTQLQTLRQLGANQPN